MSVVVVVAVVLVVVSGTGVRVVVLVLVLLPVLLLVVLAVIVVLLRVWCRGQGIRGKGHRREFTPAPARVVVLAAGTEEPPRMNENGRG